jgi:two-component system cell cycle response regulator DivK
VFVEKISVDDEFARPPERRQRDSSAGVAAMAGDRVLIVDDYEDAREMYAEYLRLVRYDVSTAADGGAALRCAAQHECDLIVLDLAMPKIDGLTVLRSLRRDPSLKTVPVIILSASVDAHVRIQSLEAGADLFLEKPCSPDELERAVRGLLAARASSA